MQNDIVLVMVMAIDKREDSAVYQSAIARISEMLSERMKAGPHGIEPLQRISGRWL